MHLTIRETSNSSPALYAFTRGDMTFDKKDSSVIVPLRSDVSKHFASFSGAYNSKNQSAQQPYYAQELDFYILFHRSIQGRRLPVPSA